MYPVKLHLFTLQNLCFTRLHRRPVIERTSGGSVARHTSGFGDKLLASSSFCSSVMIQTLLQCFWKTVSGEHQTDLLWRSHIKRRAQESFERSVSTITSQRVSRTVSWQLFHTTPNQPLASRSIHRDCLVALGTLNKGHWQGISLFSVIEYDLRVYKTKFVQWNHTADFSATVKL